MKYPLKITKLQIKKYKMAAQTERVSKELQHMQIIHLKAG